MFLEPPYIRFAYDVNGKQRFAGWRRLYQLSADFIYRDERGVLKPIVVPAGTVSDLATVPTIPFAVIGAATSIAASWLVTEFFGDLAASAVSALLIALVALLVGYFRPDGPWAAAAIIHDYLYRTGKATRAQADLIFYEVMVETGVAVPVALVMWLAVRVWGCFAYGQRKVVLLAIVVLFGCAASAEAERVLVVFSDPATCRYCRRLERTLGTREVQNKLAAEKVSVRFSNPRRVAPAVLAKYRVDIMPALRLLDVDATQSIERNAHDGDLPAAELLKFLEAADAAP